MCRRQLTVHDALACFVYKHGFSVQASCSAQATAARTLLPCMDEPAYKAVFEVSVEVRATGSVPVTTLTLTPVNARHSAPGVCALRCCLMRTAMVCLKAMQLLVVAAAHAVAGKRCSLLEGQIDI